MYLLLFEPIALITSKIHLCKGNCNYFKPASPIFDCIARISSEQCPSSSIIPAYFLWEPISIRTISFLYFNFFTDVTIPAIFKLRTVNTSRLLIKQNPHYFNMVHILSILTTSPSVNLLQILICHEIGWNPLAVYAYWEEILISEERIIFHWSHMVTLFIQYAYLCFQFSNQK